MKRFQFRDRTYPYFDHPYNHTATNERAVEVPIVTAVLQAASGRVLEIGNVLGHYGFSGHTVVDKYEHAPGVTCGDIAEHQPAAAYDLIVSISTIEHVGWDEEIFDGGKIARTLRHVRERLLARDGHALITVPLGYNPFMDRLLERGDVGMDVHYLRRENSENDWCEIALADVGVARYDHPFPAANVLAVLST